jgi:hypothetical protein
MEQHNTWCTGGMAIFSVPTCLLDAAAPGRGYATFMWHEFMQMACGHSALVLQRCNGAMLTAAVVVVVVRQAVLGVILRCAGDTYLCSFTLAARPRRLPSRALVCCGPCLQLEPLRHELVP